MPLNTLVREVHVIIRQRSIEGKDRLRIARIDLIEQEQSALLECLAELSRDDSPLSVNKTGQLELTRNSASEVEGDYKSLGALNCRMGLP